MPSDFLPLEEPHNYRFLLFDKFKLLPDPQKQLQHMGEKKKKKKLIRGL